MTPETLYIKHLKEYRHLLPKQTIKTLRGQAIAGDIKGAVKGLITSLQKANAMDMAHRETKMLAEVFDIDYKKQFKKSLTRSHTRKREVRE